MKLLVIGASRGIGAETVRAALARGHRVRAFSRSAAGTAPAEGLEPVAGDALSAADVSAAVAGMDAVILALGVPKAMRSVTRPVTLFSEATRVLVPAMQTAGVRRLIAVTGFGAGASRAAVGRILGLPFEAVLGRAYADKTRQEAQIMESGLDWTIVRPGLLTNAPASGRARALVEPSEWRMGVVSRADVARFLVEAAETGGYLHKAPVLVR